MTKKRPNLTVVGITAESLQLPNDGNTAWVVKTKMKTNDPELPEITIPTVWTKNDITKNQSPEQISNLISALLENTQESLGDLIEMHRGEGLYADCYDEEGNWKES